MRRLYRASCRSSLVIVCLLKNLVRHPHLSEYPSAVCVSMPRSVNGHERQETHNLTPCKKRFAQAHQDNYFPPRHNGLIGGRTLSPSVLGESVQQNLHIVRLTESGATPPALEALLLLRIPLLLTLQKEAEEPE
jgi:hypothetical protein